MILPSCRAFCRIGRWGESGLILTAFALRQHGLPARTLAQASAPVKLGIRPSAPGNRATFFSLSSDQILFRISSLLLTRSPTLCLSISFLATLAQDVVRLFAMQEFIIVYVTAGSPAEGDRLARALVDERLAACVNRIATVQSVYRWEGKLEQSEEQLLIIKTQRRLFAALEKRVRELHSYSVPEIVALPIIEGSQDYLRWLGDQTNDGTV